MSAESIVYSTLSGAAGVTAMVGTRIYPDLVPEEKATPYIGYERVGTEPITTIHGTILANDVQMVIACWADTRVQAEAIADAVASAMATAGYPYAARGSELDEATERLASTLDYTILT